MMQSESIHELAAALAKAQGEIKPALKSSLNPYYKSKYANLNEFWEACRKALSENQLAVIQTMDHTDKGLFLITTLAHASGQWMRSYFPLICANPSDIQAMGSAITYVRRYTLAAMVGICPDDDDDGQRAKLKSHEHFITLEQAEELAKILDECDPIYVEKVWSALKSLPKPIHTYA